MKPSPEQLRRWRSGRPKAKKPPSDSIEELHRKVRESPEGRMARIEDLSDEIDRKVRYLERFVEK
jgi:hypothetical protein